jgi:predicted DCC family thiol-disulfide oxidoreductase YuxK
MSTPVCRPVLVFDGDCAFCTTCARFAERRVVRVGSTGASTSVSTSVAPWQELDLDKLGLTPDQCMTAVQWVGENGQRAQGHAAIAATLRVGRPSWRPVGALLVTPGLSWLAAKVYGWIATHRHQMPGGTAACRVKDPNPPV